MPINYPLLASYNFQTIMFYKIRQSINAVSYFSNDFNLKFKISFFFSIKDVWKFIAFRSTFKCTYNKRCEKKIDFNSNKLIKNGKNTLRFETAFTITENKLINNKHTFSTII